MSVLRPVAVVDYQDEQVAVIRHDARTLPLEDGSVDLIVTSPPYFALRSYRDICPNCSGEGEPTKESRFGASSVLIGRKTSFVVAPDSVGSGDCTTCNGTGRLHFDGQIGSEDTPDLFLDALDECMVEWGRVLKPSGSVWINLGDKYAATGGGNSNSGLGRKQTYGKNWRLTDESIDASTMPKNNTKQTSGFVAAKSLMGLPWRFAIRQIDAGWILRAEVIWDKPNGLPESVTDRVRRSHEQWFHFVREPRYFSGVDEIREPYSPASLVRYENPTPPVSGNLESVMQEAYAGVTISANPLGRLPGSVWTIPSEPLLIPGDTRQALDLPDHFAAFPQEWPRRIITGWSPTGICTVCGEGRRPVVEKSLEHVNHSGMRAATERDGQARAMTNVTSVARESAVVSGYECACDDEAAPCTSAVILDPFGGTGTVAGVAKTLGRYGISNDLSESYNRLAIWRITQSGHFTKTEQKAWADRQGVFL